MKRFSRTENIAHKTLKLSVVAAALVLAAGFVWSGWNSPLQSVEASTLQDKTDTQAAKRRKARAAFTAAAAVFFSPRCLNCHPAGDSPLQSDTSKLHDPEVVRGIKGKGTEDLECSACHLEQNTEGDPAPPGVPDWRMPSAAQKMAFQGLTTGQLCRNLKDPLKNGGRKTAKEAVEHLATDPKVLWAWAPGNGRTTPKMSHPDFLKKMNEWVANGAACPN